MILSAFMHNTTQMNANVAQCLLDVYTFGGSFIMRSYVGVVFSTKAAKNIKSCNFHFLSEVFSCFTQGQQRKYIRSGSKKKQTKKNTFGLKQLIVNAGMCHMTDSVRRNWNEV